MALGFGDFTQGRETKTGCTKSNPIGNYGESVVREVFSWICPKHVTSWTVLVGSLGALERVSFPNKVNAR